MLAWNLPSVRRLVSAAMVVLLPSAILPAALPAQTSALASGAQVAFAGRLANYTYIDMDDCIREALDLSRAILEG